MFDVNFSKLIPLYNTFFNLHEFLNSKHDLQEHSLSHTNHSKQHHLK